VGLCPLKLQSTKGNSLVERLKFHLALDFHHFLIHRLLRKQQQQQQRQCTYSMRVHHKVVTLEVYARPFMTAVQCQSAHKHRQILLWQILSLQRHLKNVKSFPTPEPDRAHRAARISVSIDLSQIPAYTASPQASASRGMAVYAPTFTPVPIYTAC